MLELLDLQFEGFHQEISDFVSNLYALMEKLLHNCLEAVSPPGDGNFFSLILSCFYINGRTIQNFNRFSNFLLQTQWDEESSCGTSQTVSRLPLTQQRSLEVMWTLLQSSTCQTRPLPHASLLQNSCPSLAVFFSTHHFGGEQRHTSVVRVFSPPLCHMGWLAM